MLLVEDTLSSKLGSRLADSLNYFLIEISGKIQLTKTHREKAEGHYGTMADILKNSPPGSLLNKLDVKMIPFGGLGTNTATKPLLDDEFDLDLVVRFLTQTSRFGSAANLYNELHKRLHSLDTYRDKLEKKDRCIRVNYAGDFHLDLMPAAVDQLNQNDTGKLWVPEKQADGTYKFVLVDPIGLMAWFEKRCELQVKVAKADLAERGEFEAMPLISEEAKKSVLKQAVQLIKRARDVYFSEDDDCRKILKSVVILTVAGNAFSGETDLYYLVEKILNSLEQETKSLQTSSIKNPVNAQEDFLDSLRKKPARHQKLRKFISDFKTAWASLGDDAEDLDFRKESLNKLFGETVTKTVLAEYADRMEKAYRNESVRMAPSGLLGVSVTGAGLKVTRHQFFGDE